MTIAMKRYRGLSTAMRKSGRFAGVGFVAVTAAAFVAACSSSQGGERVDQTGQAVTSATSFPKATVDADLASGDVNDAFATCQEFLGTAPTDCNANYCSLIASTMMVVDSINTYVLPGERNGPPPATRPIPSSTARSAAPGPRERRRSSARSTLRCFTISRSSPRRSRSPSRTAGPPPSCRRCSRR
jgi:hypothetical protein